jgi:general secretion pathway protein I
MSHPQQSGVMLLEVLVAFSILALTLGVIMRIMAAGSTAALRADEYTNAVLLAESKLTETIAAKANISGASEVRGVTYRWDGSVEPAAKMGDPIFGGRFQMFDIYARVEWGRPGVSRRIVLHTQRILPSS